MSRISSHLSPGDSGEKKRTFSSMLLPEEEIRDVVNGFDAQSRNRLRRLAGALGLDEPSALMWLNGSLDGAS